MSKIFVMTAMLGLICQLFEAPVFNEKKLSGGVALMFDFEWFFWFCDQIVGVSNVTTFYVFFWIFKRSIGLNLVKEFGD
tara:strand:- start:21 stop:257 length:237 start_codon:yes stop_codon:yes gene_type:complete